MALGAGRWAGGVEFRGERGRAPRAVGGGAEVVRPCLLSYYLKLGDSFSGHAVPADESGDWVETVVPAEPDGPCAFPAAAVAGAESGRQTGAAIGRSLPPADSAERGFSIEGREASGAVGGGGVGRNRGEPGRRPTGSVAIGPGRLTRAAT